MAITVQVKPRKTTISSVTVARTANLNLTQLNNVDITTPANNEVLVYESGTGRWLNKSISTISGGTF
jgi:hypothetical protein